jgi:hypothetical protein
MTVLNSKTKKELVVNDEQATIVRTIFNWYINGLNNVKIHQLKQ